MEYPAFLKIGPVLVLAFLLLPAPDFGQGNKANSLRSYSRAEVNQKIEEIENILSISTDSALMLIDTLVIQYQQQKNSYGLGRAQSFKAWILCVSGRYEDALRLAHETLQLQKKLNNDSTGIALTINRIGIANLLFERYDDARKYIAEALAYFQELKDTNGLNMTLNNLGAILAAQGDREKAIEYYKRVLALCPGDRDLTAKAYGYYNVGESFLATGQLDSAEKYLLRSQSMFDTPEILVILSMAHLQEKKGNISAAIRNAKEACEHSKKQNRPDLLIESNELLASLYYKNHQYKKAYDTQQEYRRLKDRTDSINSAARVAEIEERYKSAERQAHIFKLQTQNLEVQNRAQRSRLLALIALFAALGVVVVSAWLFWLRRQRHRVHASQLQARIAETKLIALRAQMNPHFIFNCLNTTQNFVLNSEKREAYEYLAKFACLLRMVLHNSDKTFIPLQEEIEQLELYMHLEKIRFSNKFDYKIQMEPPLQEGLYRVPGMILQPLVENALLHGLVNKEGEKGLLQLSFSLSNNTIRCSITDNGVGRQKAAEMKARSAGHHQSTALSNVKERLQNLLDPDQDIQLTISDLYRDGQAAGTRVDVYLPWR